jgi:hypothetical protein
MGHRMVRGRAVAAISALIVCAVSGVLGAVLPGVSDAGAVESWAVRSGHVHVAFNVGLLHDLGLDVEVTGAEPTPRGSVRLEEPHWMLAILPGSDLTFSTERGIVLPRGGTGGAIRLAGALVLRERATGRQTRFDALEIAHLAGEDAGPTGTRGTDPLVLRSASSKLAFCELRNAMFDFRGRPSLEVHYLNARITESWARAIGRPDLAGWVVGMAEVRAETERLSATGTAEPAPAPVFIGGTLDVSLGGLADIQQVAHVGTYPTGRTAAAMSTTSCNVGTVDVPWLAPMQENHPVIHSALYRLLDGRLEQLGVSWMKHGFYALSLSDCTPCQHPSGGDFLGVGCSDTYDVFNNSDRNFLGPRSEVNAYTGTWECTGSHFAGGQPDCVQRHFGTVHGPLDHRLGANDADLANPGATYYYEACYVVPGDQNLGNNWGHRRCTMVWTGSVWAFLTPASGNPLVAGPALAGWDATATSVNVAPGDGQVLLSGTATPRGDGTYHYEYALMNLNSDRQIRSFSVPVRGVANISGIGFHDNDPDAANDWQVTADGHTITWQTETYAQNPNANALVFGYLYNFRFDADAPPAALGVTLGLFKPGAGASVVATTAAPAASVAAVGDAPAAARMIDVRPNPFRHSVTISYQAIAGPTDLAIYDASGRLVRSLVDGNGDSGVRSVVWKGDVDGGARARSGVYYARLRSGKVTAVRPLVLAD